MKLFLIRLKVCWTIITSRKKTWIFIPFKEKDMMNILNKNEFDIVATHHRLDFYIFNMFVKGYAENLTDTEMIIQKAKFQHNLDEFLKKKKRHEEKVK